MRPAPGHLAILVAIPLGIFLLLPATMARDAAAEPGAMKKPSAAADNCAARYVTHPPLKKGMFRVPDDQPPKPAKGNGYREAAHGVCIVRVTDHEKEAPKGFARVSYSRLQAFNADDSRLLVFAQDGYWHLYDAQSYEWIKRLDLGGGSVEPQWHPNDPNVLYLLPNNGGLSLLAYHVETDQKKQLVDFTQLASIAGDETLTDIRDVWPQAARLWTRWEGSPSTSARYWAFQVETRDEKPLGLVSFDLAKNLIVGTFDITDIGRPDHVSISPKGNYVVASWPSKAADCPLFRKRGTLEKPCGLMAFTRDFEKAVGLAAKSPHSDMAITADGHEVIVISNYDSGNVEMIDLADGEVTPLWRIYIDGASTAMHISGKAYRKPGWVLVSTYWTKDPKNKKPWYSNRLIAVELAAEPRIIPIAAIPSRTRTYFSEPHATVNRDFTKIAFNANWGSGKDDDIDVYIARLSPGAIPAR